MSVAAVITHRSAELVSGNAEPLTNLRIRSVDQWNLNSFPKQKISNFNKVHKAREGKNGGIESVWISTDPLTKEGF